MKKIVTLVFSILLVCGMVCGIAAASVGPAPNSGDCIPDGSGFDQPNQLNAGNGNGPAPNAGDGIPDGSGF
jgi:hypothetical protein